MGISLKDVAQRAGVSIKTVSNVVNGYRHVTPQTRQRVQRAIDELGYRPNLTARHLRKGRTGMIALAVPELTNPYFAELADAVIEHAAGLDYIVLLDHTGGRRDQEVLFAQGFRARVIDGLILSPIELENEDLLARESDAPLVLLGEREYSAPYDHIAIDNVAAARTAAAHLVEIGRRRVAFVGARHGRARATAHLRLRGWREVMGESGLPSDDALIAVTDGYSREDGAQAVARLLDSGQRPDAVFCYNDLIAVGAMRTLAERGLRVPDDVAVVGFDDIEESRYGATTLTTVAPHKRAIARAATDMLLDRLAGEADTPPRRIQPGFALITRESTVGRP
ncbi:LacI family DNA-binding transcriptional regulator [Nocardiopsis flavescens]|uniref:DNA-binding transcriptional regulator, LacI/PurR family n=1 Tax=Nocardiopsis flavescens TaxID=758803 RepID=A0A1M6MSQ0_9ACTN|nr:LacI family DNA-binding transcriptional regulator [Nocardiopsis flavescens]SHJ86474.1 DNA-binding transcriptional regulator, LacI/PurR family [Nocardiopsis flavescens]